MRAPAALLAVPLLVGSAVGLLAFDSVGGALRLAAAAAALIALLAAIAAAADDDVPVAVVATGVGAICAGVSLGLSAAAAAYAPPLLRWFDAAPPGERSNAVIAGVLREDAAVTPAGVALTLHVISIRDQPAAGGVRLSVAGSLAAASLGDWRAGRRVQLTASLRRPTVYLNPGVPDETRALARRGIALVGSVKSAALVEVVARGTAVDEWAASTRAGVRRRIAASVGAWSARSSGVATAILIGDRTGLSSDDERRLQAAGTYHVIAISGGNVAILTGLLLGLLHVGRVPRKPAAAIAIALLLAYGRITGPAPSVDRAILAAAVLLAGRLLEERGPSLNVLAWAAVCAVATSPVGVFDPGFLLSFGATLGILVGVERLMSVFDRGRLARRGEGVDVAAPPLVVAVRAVIAVVAATACAEIVLAPIAAAIFGRVTAAGLVLNLVAIPMMTVVQAGSLAALAVSHLSMPAASACGYVVHRAASWLIDSAWLVEAAPWLARDVPAPAWWLLAVYYAGVLTTVAASRYPAVRRTAAVASIAAGAAIVTGLHVTSRDGVPVPAAGVLRIVFLDVGQGDATLIQLPDGRAYLVDAGGLPLAGPPDPLAEPSFDVGDRVVARALRAFGVRSLDALALTHGDPDHIGGAPSILQRFAPPSLWTGVPVPSHAALEALRLRASAQQAEWRTTVAGDRVQIGEVVVETLHPPVPEWERQRVRNDDSVTLAIHYRDVQIVLPGDIGREGEAEVAALVSDAPVTILKAAHHGSATSSTPALLAALRPDVAVFSAGRDNRFGHPAPVVVSRFRAMNTRLFSTADDGAVIVETDGRSVSIEGWGSGRSVHLSPRR